MERFEEQDITHDERRVSELLGSLRHVSAPADFETKVRSRIASRRGSVAKFSWTPIVAVAMSVLVIAFGVYLAMRPAKTVVPSSDVSATTGTQTLPAPPPSSESAPVFAPVPSPETAALPKQPANALAPRDDRKGGGSVDEALTEGSKFYPRGVDPRANGVTDTRGVGGNAQLSIANLLSGLGVTASWNGVGWQVSSVAEHSVPESAGLRKGDVIESIGGETLAADTSFSGSFTARTMRVKRDGSVLEIRFGAP